MVRIEIQNEIIRKNIQLFQRLGIALLMLTITRLIFVVVNASHFPEIFFTDFLAGIWIDTITIGLYFLPFYILSLLPHPIYSTKWYQKVLAIFFHITNGVLIALNLIDVEYFQFTSKRSTADLFSMMEIGNSWGAMLLSFLEDFWWLFLIFVVLFIISFWLYKKTKLKVELKSGTHRWGWQIINLIAVGAVLIIVSRGGFGYRPADTLIAAKYTTLQNTPLVLNTPLSVIKTIDKPALAEKKFFPAGSNKIYSPIYHPQTKYKIQPQPNIMVIILESFGNEWIGKVEGTVYTPFLDSLLDQSIYFTNAYADGKKSIEAVPAIFASVPSLLNNPYITSAYGANKVKSLVHCLSDLGYSSGFYHGATNGSMNFDVFAAHLGFQHYYGRSEYNNEAHCGPSWGVLDEYFLPWTAKNITKNLKQPFIAGLFTLSSHHPYYVPEEYRKVLPEGNFPMSQAIAYADMSLRKFFATAKTQPWYQNTIFILTSDHTPAPINSRYSQRTKLHQIPIAIFDPQHRLGGPKEVHKIFSQIDIMPTVLDLVGYNKATYTFGNSWFSNEVPFAVNYLKHSYVLFQNDYMLQMVGKKMVGLYNYKKDVYMKEDSSRFYPKLKQEMEQELKGFIQRYNHDLIYNSMTLKAQTR